MVDPFRTPNIPEPAPRLTWQVRIIVGALIVLAMAVVWVTNTWMSQRYTETTRNRAELRLVLYSGNIMSELQRNSVVPLLLARDPELINALNAKEYQRTSQRLISFQSEIGAASILLLDADGRIVAATDRNTLGASQRSAAYFVDTQRSDDTVFTAERRDGGINNLFAIGLHGNIGAHHDNFCAFGVHFLSDTLKLGSPPCGENQMRALVGQLVCKFFANAS